jgi:Uma2 family endonuclease
MPAASMHDLERRFTRDEFNRLVELGFFAADPRRIELIHGRLLVVPPQGPEDAFTSTDLRDRLTAAYAGLAHVRDDKPLDCGSEEQPEPDLAVVGGAPREYKHRHPRGEEARLVIEVSRTTQERDHEKASIYASAGVPEYWIVDLPSRRVEVHREPKGDRYTLVRLVAEDGELEVPGTSVRVVIADLLG